MMEMPIERDVCLCCGERLHQGGQARTSEKLEQDWQLLQELGYSRDDLLTLHREQCEYQIPGLIEWLTAQ